MKKKSWPELCKLVEDDDGLPTRESGSWAEDKLFFWNRYIDITTTAMVDHPAWPEGLVYLDLFAGPGICSIRGSNRRVPGSPLIAAHAPKQFRKILLCELDPKNAMACEQRLKQSPASDRYNPRNETSSGEIFDPSRDDNLASPIYPNGTTLLVQSPSSGFTAIVLLKNSGPTPARRLDVSQKLAKRLGFKPEELLNCNRT